MTKPAIDYRKLSIPERLELVEGIWDSIAQDAEVFPLSDEQKAELDRRLEAHRRDPESAIRWAALNPTALGFLVRTCETPDGFGHGMAAGFGSAAYSSRAHGGVSRHARGVVEPPAVRASVAGEHSCLRARRRRARLVSQIGSSVKHEQVRLRRRNLSVLQTEI